jgi:hypothetical protein
MGGKAISITPINDGTFTAAMERTTYIALFPNTLLVINITPLPIPVAE